MLNIVRGWNCGLDRPDDTILEIHCDTEENANKIEQEIIKALEIKEKLEKFLKEAENEDPATMGRSEYQRISIIKSFLGTIK